MWPYRYSGEGGTSRHNPGTGYRALSFVSMSEAHLHLMSRRVTVPVSHVVDNPVTLPTAEDPHSIWDRVDVDNPRLPVSRYGSPDTSSVLWPCASGSNLPESLRDTSHLSTEYTLQGRVIDDLADRDFAGLCEYPDDGLVTEPRLCSEFGRSKSIGHGPVTVTLSPFVDSRPADLYAGVRASPATNSPTLPPAPPSPTRAAESHGLPVVSVGNSRPPHPNEGPLQSPMPSMSDEGLHRR